jgi:uncharacterized protein
MLPPFFVTPLYAALCGILLIMLSLRVVRYRQKFQVSLGDGGHPELQAAIRAQGNFAEYAPLALFLLFLLELTRDAPVWALHLLGAALFLGRAIHAWGVLTSAPRSKPKQGRPIGIVMTFAMLLITALWLLIIALKRLAM